MPYTGASTFATQRAPLQAQISRLLSSSSSTVAEFSVSTVIVSDTPNPSGAELLADVYHSLPRKDYETVISISPSHQDEFKQITICSLDSYGSPIGEVKVDDQVRNELCDEDDDIYLHDHGHFNHTGIDVQLPFLQETLDSFSIVPLVMGTESPEYCTELGNALGEIVTNKNILVVACMDIDEATEKGLELFKKHLENLDIDAMMTLLNQETEIKVTGKGSVLVAMIAAKHRRADAVKLNGLLSPGETHQGFAGALLGRY